MTDFSEVFRVRFEAQQRALIDRAAAQRGVSTSEFVRQACRLALTLDGFAEPVPQEQ